MNITDLLQRLRENDSAAASELVAGFEHEILRLSLSILGDPAEAEDATQETFITAIRALDTYRGEASFRTWLFRIAINSCRGRWRKRQAVERLTRTLHSAVRWMGLGPAQPEEIVVRREARTMLWEAVDTLDEKFQFPLLLFYQYDMPVNEIAQVLGVPVGTVLSRLHTGRVRLAKILKEPAEELEQAGES